jgi:hypothetical protein
MLTYRAAVADALDLQRPSDLWKLLSPERKLEAAAAFWRDENAALEQAEVVGAIAHRIKFRPKSVRAQPLEKKARQLVGLAVLSDLVAARLLVAYHLAHQRPMMASFLDALGVTHDNGVIADEEMPPPPEDRLREAAAAIGRAYPADDVAVYLSTLVWQDVDTWGKLAEVPERRPPSAS